MVGVQVGDEDVLRSIAQVRRLTQVQQDAAIDQDPRMPSVVGSRRQYVSSGAQDREAHGVTARNVSQSNGAGTRAMIMDLLRPSHEVVDHTSEVQLQVRA